MMALQEEVQRLLDGLNEQKINMVLNYIKSIMAEDELNNIDEEEDLKKRRFAFAKFEIVKKSLQFFYKKFLYLKKL